MKIANFNEQTTIPVGDYRNLLFPIFSKISEAYPEPSETFKIVILQK